MQKIILIKLAIISIILFCVIPILSQETPKTDSVGDSQKIQVASNGDGATVCEQRLLKTLDALDKAESLNKSLQDEVDSLRRLAKVNNEIIAAKETVIAEQKKLIEILEKKSKRKISVLFGVIKINY